MPLAFGNPDEARTWADEWAGRHSPSPVVLDIIDYERQHFEQFNRDYGRLVVQFEVQYTALVQLLDQVNFIDRSSWPPHRCVQYVLLSYNVKPFYSAMDRLSKGFYEDAVTLIRTLYETFLRAAFISCHPADPYAALVDRPPGVPVFNVTNFVRDELKLDWSSNYGIMSLFAHSNTHQTLEALKRAAERSSEPERFGLKFEYDVRLAELAAAFVQFLLVLYLRFAIERFVGTGTPADLDQFTTAKESRDLLTYVVVNHPKEYWQRTALDIDLLFQTLEVADQGGDWRACVRARQP